MPEQEMLDIRLEYDVAEKLSAFIFNAFIQDFFDFSQAVDSEYMSFDELLKLCDLMIRLKAAIDDAIDKTI